MTVLITGATRGIGKALASKYEDRGETVIGTYRSACDIEGWLQVDVGDPQSVRTMAASLDGRPVDLLVCNAGIYPDKGQALDTGYGADLWDETFRVNVRGVFLVVQALLPHLRAAAPSKIAIVSSQMGSSERATGGSYIYRASKAAALNLGRNLAHDLAADRIAVGIYHPGWVRTDMGGQSADITVDEAAAGLMDRFDALSLRTTGVFETWDGRPHPF